MEAALAIRNPEGCVLTLCDSCHRPCVAVYVLEHRRKGEKTATSWSVGSCCWAGQGGETTKKEK